MPELRLSWGRLEFVVSLGVAEVEVEGDGALSESVLADSDPPPFGFFRFLWDEGGDEE